MTRKKQHDDDHPLSIKEAFGKIARAKNDRMEVCWTEGAVQTGLWGVSSIGGNSAYL